MKEVEIKLERVNDKQILQIDNVAVPITDYQIKSSADGTTELIICMKGKSSIFDLSTNLQESKQYDL